VGLVLSVVGWDYLTPQGIRIGVASFIAVLVLTPARSRDENLFTLVLMVVAGILVAQAISIGAQAH
jgi:hypothetical protein